MNKKYLIILVLLVLPVGHSIAQTKNFLLVARNTAEFTMWDDVKIRGFGFAPGLGNAPLPGPTLFMNEGDSVVIDLWNISQGAPHTIHLHGLDVNQQNDGVPHLSFAVTHMEHGFYRFRAPHAGSYLYHCHVASTIHVQAGMYGMIVVRPSHGMNQTWQGGYWYDLEKNWLSSEIDTMWHKDSILEHDHDTDQVITQVFIPEYNPQYFMINGRSEHELNETETAIRVHQGESLYLRIANIGFMANRIGFPKSLKAKIISSDGRPLPLALDEDTLWIFPGERYGVLLKPDQTVVDSISYAYINLNTMQTVNTQFIKATTEFVSTGELQEPEIGLKVYPVPSTSGERKYVEINATSLVDGRLEIINTVGRVIYQRHIIGTGSFIRVEINEMDIPSGIYWCRFIDKAVNSSVSAPMVVGE